MIAWENFSSLHPTQHSATFEILGYASLSIKVAMVFNLTSHNLLHASESVCTGNTGSLLKCNKLFVSALAWFFGGILSHNLQNVLMKYMKLSDLKIYFGSVKTTLIWRGRKWQPLRGLLHKLRLHACETNVFNPLNASSATRTASSLLRAGILQRRKSKPRDSPTRYRGLHAPKARRPGTPYLHHRGQCGNGKLGLATLDDDTRSWLASTDLEIWAGQQVHERRRLIWPEFLSK